MSELEPTNSTSHKIGSDGYQSVLSKNAAADVLRDASFEASTTSVDVSKREAVLALVEHAHHPL